MAYIFVFKDISEGYRLGRYALAVTNKTNMPEVYCIMYGTIAVWKEPLQAILPEHLNSCKVGMEVLVRFDLRLCFDSCFFSG